MIISNKLIPFEKLVYSLIVIIVAIIIRLFINQSLNIIFKKLKGKINQKKIIAKTKTLRSLFQNIVDVSLFLVALLTILSGWGVDIIPLVTGAGILGLAISFGAQSLVKDIIAGIFILWEDQFNIGDKVKIGNLEGYVYKITLRMTILKDEEEKLIFIPNSQIKSVVLYPKA